jgi:16S rRNA (guanine1207-N2)-methyltransferase
VLPIALSGDAHLKKTLTVRLHRRQLELEVAHGLFSGTDLDVGTRLLLRTLATPEHDRRLSVVDLGCGYGPLGLGLKLLVPQRSVDMVDRDALAVTFSRRNAQRNGMADVQVYGGLGWSSVRRQDFDLAVCNVPAKAGEGAIRHFLLDARRRLRSDGLVAIVVVARLHELVSGLLTEASGIEVAYTQRSAGYSVFHYGFAPGGPHADGGEDPLAVYERARLELVFKDVAYELRTAYSLPEFDTLGYQTRLVAERLLSLHRRPRHVLVFNAGQGHLPILAWKQFAPEQVSLAGRDLLALEYSRDNLVRNGCPAERIALRHQVGLQPEDGEGVDLAVAIVEEGQPAEVSASELVPLVSSLQPPATVLLGGGSTDISRLEGVLRARARVVARKRHRGHSALELAA